MPGDPTDLPEAPDPPQTHQQFILAFAAGSTDAFAELFRRYKQPLFGFYRRRLADPAPAEELTQETWVALLRASSRYQPSALFRTYLYAIAFKILRAHRRKAAFRAVFQANSGTHEPATRNTFDTSLILRDAVRRLDPHDREVLLLREFEQLSYAEIADLLGLPLNTVRSRLFRARSALHDLLTAPAPTPIPALTQSPSLAESQERI